MDPRINGHGDDDRLRREPDRARRRADAQPPRPSTAASLRAADQLARLEARIRDFHRNLEPFDGVEADVERLTRRTAENSAAADSLIRRAAAAARLAADVGEWPSPTDEPAHAPGTEGGADRPPPASEPEGSARRPQADGRAEGPFSAQRRIDALRPETRASARDGAPAGRPTRAAPDPARASNLAAQAQAVADRIREDAEQRAEQLLTDARRDAAATRHEAEQEMQHLWQAIETEIETIQTEISQRVDFLTERMEAAGQESEQLLSTAITEAEQIRGDAFAEATRIRGDAAEDAERLLAAAECEAHALLTEARARADALIAENVLSAERAPVTEDTPVAEDAEPAVTAAPDRSGAERIAEQIRDATAALTRRVSRAGEDAASAAREIRSCPGVVPASLRDVLDGLGAAVSLFERSLAGLAELLDPFGSDDLEED